MKKLLFVGINARYTHSNLALRYLRNFVAELEYKSKILEFSINQDFLEILEQIEHTQSDILAFSVYIWNTEITYLLLSEIKKILPEIKIILGGPEVSYNPEDWLSKFPEIDFIVCGAGEAGLKYLLENNLNTQNEILRMRNPHFSEIPFPYLQSDFPEINDKYLYYESSRGCSFKCSYCLSSRIDQALQFRDLESVKKELKFLIEQKPRIIKFVDRTFNAKKEHSRKIWKFLIELDPHITFHFEIHPELLEDEDLQILKTCPKGLFQFEIGIQSTNYETLNAIHRVNNWEKTTYIVYQLMSFGNIHIHVDLIAGLPFEDMSGFERSFNDIFNLNTDHFQLGFLKILPGTEMSENAKKFGITSTKISPYIILKNNWLSFNEINKIHKIEDLLEIFSNSNKFKITLKYLIPEFKSPFIFFNELLYFLKANNFDLHTKNWQKNGVELKQFANKKFPDQTDFFFDCLRWDWCLQAKSHYYPEFLKSELNVKAKQIGKELLNSQKIIGKMKLKNIEFTISDLKRAIYFMAASDEFKQKNLPVSEIAIFITGEPIQSYILQENLSR
ncbi:MAG: radical SAM protein [Candidatus Tenebribacter burtonii]|nr:radical SAM protein [Candidatus Tenebribacter burtonii]